jgi:signal transduction histidine kinase
MPTIYVIDDDVLATTSLARLLEIEGNYRVRAFQTGLDALEAMRADPPDLVISDLRMPNLDGVAVLRQVRKLSPDAALIVMTGHTDQESIVRAINTAGLYGFLEKPWDNAQVLVSVQNALEKVALVRRLKERNLELERTLAELRDAQDRLVAAERLAAVGRVASGIAHEIGNQLALLGYAELIGEHHADDPETREMVEPLLAARRRLGVMVEAIKDFARGSAKASYERVVQPVRPIVDDALDILRFDKRMRGRSVVREPDDPAVSACVNGDKILQVVLNLIGNALQATREGGRVRIGIARDGDHSIIEVEDNGCGIPPETLERIWEPFFTTKGARGTGLGLGISRRIVEEHGGRIEVVSRPDEGTRFRVELPYDDVRGDT